MGTTFIAAKAMSNEALQVEYVLALMLADELTSGLDEIKSISHIMSAMLGKGLLPEIELVRWARNIANPRKSCKFTDLQRALLD